MPISPTNRPKNNASFSNRKKTYNSVYGIAVYGISTYGTGIAGLGFIVNRIKTLTANGMWMSFLVPWTSMTLSWEDYDGVAWKNRTKS